MNLLVAALAGVLFGFGLDLARLTDPERVLGFLDVAGRWDPTLAFVMAGAVLVAGTGFRLAARRGVSWLGEPLRLPARHDLDAPLVGGAAIFGVGWGLAGYCPGPGLAATVQGAADPAWFALGMVLGMLAFARIGRGAR